VLVHPVGILFYTGWSLAKWALDKNTQEKVQPMLYLTGIQQHISDDFIPEHMVRIIPETHFVCYYKQSRNSSLFLRSICIGSSLDIAQ
jgi:hypothetical protein